MEEDGRQSLREFRTRAGIDAQEHLIALEKQVQRGKKKENEEKAQNMPSIQQSTTTELKTLTHTFGWGVSELHEQRFEAKRSPGLRHMTHRHTIIHHETRTS